VGETSDQTSRPGYYFSLSCAAKLAGWATPTTRDHKDGTTDLEKAGVPVNCLLGRQVSLAGWVTPTACSPNSLRGSGQDPLKRIAGGHAVNLQDQVRLASGPPTTSSPAATAKRAALDPAFSLYLMGFPPSWSACAPSKLLDGRK
jgi:hypothetical protein